LTATKHPELATANVIGLAHEYPAGTEEIHSHEEFAQVMYAVRGSMTVSTAHGCWVLPPQRALWIPVGVSHTFSHSRPISLRTVYVRQGTAGMPPWDRCSVMEVTGLIRELILTCVKMPWDHMANSRAGRIGEVLLDQLKLLQQESFFLPDPTEPRALRAAELARADNENVLQLKEIARQAGASDRTLDRLFFDEVGMGFGAWRRRLRLTLALERLAAGEPVAVVAAAIGYRNPSSFVAVFKSVFGATPAKYFS
jgi:AraC-like DNA-binding protein/mannose-6-phosphate isomerase-like protein (cupin superfamily)